MSKILSPGLRVGFLIAPPELLAKATMCKQFSDAHTSNLTQATAAKYLGLGRLDGALAKSARHLRRTRPRDGRMSKARTRRRHRIQRTARRHVRLGASHGRTQRE